MCNRECQSTLFFILLFNGVSIFQKERKNTHIHIHVRGALQSSNTTMVLQHRWNEFDFRKQEDMACSFNPDSLISCRGCNVGSITFFFSSLAALVEWFVEHRRYRCDSKILRSLQAPFQIVSISAPLQECNRPLLFLQRYCSSQPTIAAAGIQARGLDGTVARVWEGVRKEDKYVKKKTCRFPFLYCSSSVGDEHK